MDDLANLNAHLKDFGLSSAAMEWLLDVWRVCQIIDDAVDSALVAPEEAYEATWAVFVRMPLNPFWIAHREVLLPVLTAQVLKWQASDEAERAGEADERSYMWRAGFYELVLMVCQLCGITGRGREILSLYGETFAEYRKEFPCQTP